MIARLSGPCFTWDALIERGETDNERLRDRTFPAMPDAGRDLWEFLKGGNGPGLPVYACVDPDFAVLFWTTHEPSAREYVRLRPEARVVYLGPKGGVRAVPSRSFNITEGVL